MNEHEEIRNQLSAYCGDDLRPEERVRVEQHLKRCGSCKDALADLQTALRLIRTTPEAEPPLWLAGKIMAQIREEQQKKSWFHRIFFPLHVKLPIEVAAVVMISVCGYYLLRQAETELRQQPNRQEAPAVIPQPAIPTPATEPEPPAAARPAPPPSSPTPGASPESAFAPPPPAAGPTQKGAPPLSESSPPQPSPAAPAAKEERTLPAREPMQKSVVPRQESPTPATKARKPAAAGDIGTGDRDMSESESIRGASQAPVEALPQVRLRIDPFFTASAPRLVREAVIHSGGTVVEERPAAITARVPAHRIDELVARLRSLGTIADRPPMRDSAGTADVIIEW